MSDPEDFTVLSMFLCRRGWGREGKERQKYELPISKRDVEYPPSRITEVSFQQSTIQEFKRALF